MKIYTSYFGKLRKISKDIAICSKSPDWYRGIEYKKLAPKYDFFIEWKKNQDNIKCFKEQVLDLLNVDKVVEEFYQLTEGKDIVLLCYEKSGNFYLVADWLSENGYDVEEIK